MDYLVFWGLNRWRLRLEEFVSWMNELMSWRWIKIYTSLKFLKGWYLKTFESINLYFPYLKQLCLHYNLEKDLIDLDFFIRTSGGDVEIKGNFMVSRRSLWVESSLINYTFTCLERVSILIKHDLILLYIRGVKALRLLVWYWLTFLWQSMRLLKFIIL